MFLWKTKNILNLNKFLEEVIELNQKIVYVIKFEEDDLRFTLSEELSEVEESELDVFIEAFADVNPEDKIPLIYDFVKDELRSKHFHNIDIDNDLTTTLQKESTIVAGEIIKEVFYRKMTYENIDGFPIRQYETPVLKIETSYIKDATGFTIGKNPPLTTFYNKDGTENEETKQLDQPYYYEDFEQIEQSVKRRQLIDMDIQKKALKHIFSALSVSGYTLEACMLKAMEFADAYEDLRNKYKDNSSVVSDPNNDDFGKKHIVVALEDDSVDGINMNFNLWLNAAPASLGGLKTIRQYLIEQYSL